MLEAISTEPAKVKLNVGCGRNILSGWINIDSWKGAGIDIVHNFESRSNLPIAPGTVDEFLLSHVIEHIHNSLGLMQELHRVAKPGAHMEIRTPYGSSDDAWEDPTHVRPYFLNSFSYFSQPAYWRADYGYRGDWRVKQIILFTNPEYSNPMEVLHSERNVVTEMVAFLEAVKPIREPKRELQEELNVVMF